MSLSHGSDIVRKNAIDSFKQATDPVIQTTLAGALQNPSAYPHPVNQVDMLETHISYVFLAGPFAYKVKKAVELGFLDFRSLKARAFDCEEELRLNRRLAPSLYMDVVAITGSPARPIVGGNGPPVEYAIKMHRFSQDLLLDRLLARNQLTSEQVDELAQKIARFHASISVASTGDAFGTAEAVQQPALENFSQLRDAGCNSPDLTMLEDWTTTQCKQLEETFNQRKKNGFVRECHGDFHLGNIALVQGEMTIFDCLEFNANLRWIDVMNEAAFLVMDLQDRQRPDLAQRFLNRYLEITGDYAGLQVLRFYIVYRAIVRAKIHWLRANQSDVNAARKADLIAQHRDYIALAKNHIVARKPAIIITHGLSGSGKTMASQSLLETIKAILIRSDIERKRSQGLAELAQTESSLNGGLYSADTTTLTYQRLLDLARIIAEASYPVIVDATFLKRSQRDRFRQLAQAINIECLILDFPTDEATLRARVMERKQRRDDASEADIPVLEYQLATQEPLQPDEQAMTAAYDSTFGERWRASYNR